MALPVTSTYEQVLASRDHFRAAFERSCEGGRKLQAELDAARLAQRHTARGAVTVDAQTLCLMLLSTKLLPTDPAPEPVAVAEVPVVAPLAPVAVVPSVPAPVVAR